ncbi:hypothetical protein FC40_GL001456 [Ligilactobacillus hayakitensis DSM 18933 = JCM 14209]|uniref:HTH tetR-type domain-containing protein n=1 Tax=Ligilactobacillus hayakitensis DSM 18933 = JCM 14209 TaxID=1423755 RepID=A0A0R1WNV6_9LACO|nr:TetR-like C-terminal domain-containing protein [Ligilactobacillus hayakitensis]KRM19608.1 hypothetical protein FC40_GL001456 [Ligilactobacillus hayakitensis DSM 18933 = JCM 14209]
MKKAKVRLVEGLVKLIQETPFNQITINELSEASGTSRRTFYMHYSDKYDFLDSIERELLLGIKQAAEKDSEALLAMEGRPSSEMMYIFAQEAFYNLIKYSNENRKILRALFSKNGDSKFTASLQQIMDDEVVRRFEIMHSTFGNVIPADYARSLYSAVIMNTFAIWLGKDEPESPTEFADILGKVQIFSPFQFTKKIDLDLDINNNNN